MLAKESILLHSDSTEHSQLLLWHTEILVFWHWELLDKGNLAIKEFLIKKRIATRRKSNAQTGSLLSQHTEPNGTETGAKIRRQRESVSRRTWKTGRPGQVKKQLSGETSAVITQLTVVPRCTCKQQLNRYSHFRNAWSVSSTVWHWGSIICFVTSPCPATLTNNAEPAAEAYRSTCWILFWLTCH